MSDLPDLCFCGCGERRSQDDAANLEGVLLSIHLGRWLNYVTVANAVSEPEDWAQVRDFTRDGHRIYENLYRVVHQGDKLQRKTTRARKKWCKQSERGQAAASGVVHPDEVDPFTASPPHPQQVRAWVFEGTLLPVAD